MPKPRFLMCPPDFFAIAPPHPEYGAANLFQAKYHHEFDADPQGFAARARAQWQALKDAIEAAGGEVKLLPAHDVEPDGPFAADASLTLVKENGRRVVFISQFANILRQSEADNHRIFLETLFPDAEIVIHRYPCEGTGDNLFDPFRKCLWAGHAAEKGTLAAGRSDRAAHPLLAAHAGLKVHALEVVSPYFHMDTALAALPHGHLIVNRDGVTAEALRDIRREAFTPFGLDEKTHLHLIEGADAAAFGCNLITVNGTVIMPKTSDAFRRVIEDWGYEVVQVDVGQFIKAGGAVHCLTNVLDQGVRS